MVFDESIYVQNFPIASKPNQRNHDFNTRTDGIEISYGAINDSIK